HMKRTKFTESQIVKALRENEQGRSVGDISRELGIDKSTFYYWRKKYVGMEQQQLKRLKELEEENNRLKQMYADVSLDNKMLKDVLSKKF
ncbi:transposase, partial [Arenibacter sp. F26102]